MQVYLAIAALLAGLFGIYHCGRALGSKAFKGKPNWSSLRLSFLAGGIGWSLLFAVHGNMLGCVGVFGVFFFYFLNCGNHRREGYAIIGMLVANACGWIACL